ncbi:MAG TPA: hypothetical protein VFO69_09305 [Allosphingosinicella sp.]|nr:hypothetical protein [Allosphingosinicella sp.]
MKQWTARRLGIACGLTSAFLGFAYLLAAGAPMPSLAIQAAALALGLVALPILAILSRMSPPGGADVLLVLLGSALLLTALFGLEASGATRWVRLGAVNLQPSLALLPPMLLLYARRPGPVGASGMILAAIGLALQPDRAMAGALAVSLTTLAIWRPDPFTFAGAAGGILAFAAALAQPDSLPAVPFVDNILYSAFDVHPLTGFSVLAGAVILLLPVFGTGKAPERLVFGAVWLAILLAAAIGNYPTPVVGYGGSALLGYWLSVALLPDRLHPEPARDATDSAAPEPSPGDPLLRAAV